MKICWLRHGEKETAFGPHRENPGLTPEGHRQAQRLVELVSQKKLPQPTSLIASPAKRAHQTLEPLAKTLGLNVQTQLLFNQRLRAESAKDFHQRVLRALRWLEEYPHEQGSPKTVIFICSHIDWLNEAYGSLTSTEPLPFLGLWRPGEYLVFDMEKGLWKTIEQGVL